LFVNKSVGRGRMIISKNDASVRCCLENIPDDDFRGNVEAKNGHLSEDDGKRDFSCLRSEIFVALSPF